MAKITKATVKSFIKKNSDNLFINVKSVFDGMIDGCVSFNGGFIKVEKIDGHANEMGICGAWFVGQSRDYFREYEDNSFLGIEVYNSCGTFIIAVQK
jgi:hypothetical protein